METLITENKTKNKFSVEKEKVVMEFRDMPVPNKPTSINRADLFMHSLSMIIYAVIFYVLLSNV